MDNKVEDEQWYNKIVDDSVKEAQYINYAILNYGVNDVTLDLGKIVRNEPNQKADFFIKSRLILSYEQIKMLIDLLQSAMKDIDKWKKEEEAKRARGSDTGPMHR